MLTNLHRNNRGFTVVELMIVILISGILATVLFGPLDDLYTSNTRGLKSVIKTADTRGALRTIERKISLSDSFYGANQITDPSGATWAWTGTSSTSRVLITGNYATTIDEAADPTNARALVYDSTCTTPLMNNYIYFVSNGTLYRRTLKNTTLPASTCGSLTIGQKQTCATSNTASYCEGKDAAILSDVTSFTVDYYTNAGDSTTIPDQYVTDTIPESAESIVLTLTAKSGDSSLDSTSTSTLRITRVNGS